VLEGVVQVVDVLADRLPAAGVPDQPELLLVADVGQVPDQRGHDRRVLRGQLRIVEQVGGQRLGPAAGPVEVVRDALA
jgi:hypothetical protein